MATENAGKTCYMPPDIWERCERLAAASAIRPPTSAVVRAAIVLGLDRLEAQRGDGITSRPPVSRPPELRGTTETAAERLARWIDANRETHMAGDYPVLGMSMRAVARAVPLPESTLRDICRDADGIIREWLAARKRGSW